MDIIRLFQDAALHLQQEPVYLELTAAAAENDCDTVLQELIQKYGAIRKSLNLAAEKGEAAVELDAQAIKLYGEIMAYPGIVRYHKAKAEAEYLISRLGEIITTAMNGGDPYSSGAEKNSCQGSCSACQGCHPCEAAE